MGYFKFQVRALESSKNNNITIAITATANAIAVAEHVMFMLLNISKRTIRVLTNSWRTLDEKLKLKLISSLYRKSAPYIGFCLEMKTPCFYNGCF